MQEFGVQPRAAGDPVESAYRLHSRAVLASLIRLLGGFDLAEEGLHEAFLAAASSANAQQHRRWPSRVPNIVRLSLPGTVPKRFIARSVTRKSCACQPGVITAASFS